MWVRSSFHIWLEIWVEAPEGAGERIVENGNAHVAERPGSELLDAA